MDRRAGSARRILVPLALLATSAALHALMIAGASLRFPSPGPASPPVARAVEVALLTPPAPPPASPASPASPPPVAQAPRSAPATRPAPRRSPPAPQRSEAASAATAPAAHAPIAASEWGGDEGAAPADRAGSAPSPGESAAGESLGAGVADTASPAGAPDEAARAGTAAEPSTVPAEVVAAGAAPVAGSAAEPAGAAPLPALPESHSQAFRVFWGDYSEARSVARLEYRLSRTGERYEIRTEGEAEGLISLVYSGTLTQHSIGRIAPTGLVPTRYVEQRGKRPERIVTLDPDAARLHPVGGGAPVPMPAGTQDRLSVFYQLGLLARAQPERFAAGAAIELPVATMREVRTERFQVVGEEVLPTGRGPVRALHLSRPSPPGTDDPRIELWLGYDFGMLPVRLRIEDSGRRVLDQVIDG